MSGLFDSVDVGLTKFECGLLTTILNGWVADREITECVTDALDYIGYAVDAMAEKFDAAWCEESANDE